MVGIAGRSKACRTCKRRKIKCDETKPICMRCRKAYMMCEGYADEGDRTFVDESAKFAASTFILQRHGPVELQEPETSAQGRVQRLDSPNIALHHVELEHPSDAPDVGLSGLEIDACVSYMVSRLFPGGPIINSTSSPIRSWVLDAIEEDVTTTVYYATCGLAMAYYGHRNRENTRLAAGAEYYGQALSQLHHNLQDPQLCWNPGNIAAAILLVVYELSVFNNKVSWIQHASGLDSLIRTRGPQSFKADPARKYFMIARIPLMARALTIRRRTFLEGEEWQNVPWEDCLAPKPHLQYLLDILSPLPGLLEDSDRMSTFQRETQAPPCHVEMQVFQNKLTTLVSKLFVWRYTWEDNNPHGAYEVKSSDITPIGGADTLHFDSVLYYADFHAAGRAMMLYNGGLLLALDLAATWQLLYVTRNAVALADSERDPPRVVHNPLVLPHDRISIPEIANEVRRSTQYHLQGAHVNAGAMLLLLPLRLLARFSATDAEKRWLVNVIQTIAQASGFVTSGALLAHVRPTQGNTAPGGPARSRSAPAGLQNQHLSFLNIILGDADEEIMQTTSWPGI